MILSNEALLAKRQQADTLADDVVAAIFKKGNTKAVAELFNQLTQNIDIPRDSLPQEAIDYFEDTKALPPYYDQEKINLAQKVFGVYGPEISMILLCKSLPQCYACAKGAKVLYHTGRFVEHDDNFDMLTRRLMETAQFVIYVLAPGSFAAEGKAIVTAQKVRLIHASIRYFINQSGHWDADYYGEPINQEDMAGTLMSFSALVIEGLDRLGIDLSTEEQEAFMHLWHVIGHYMGVNENLIPSNYADGLKLGYAIFNQQAESSKEGIALTKSAIQFMEYVTPGNLFDFIPESLVHYLLGEKTAKIVGVNPPDNFFEKKFPLVVHSLLGVYDKLEENHSLLRKLSMKFNRVLLQGLLTFFNNGKAVSFDIPPNLQEDWNLIPIKS